MLQAAFKGGKSVGSAGMATAYVSQQLNLPCTIILPTTTPTFVAENLKKLVRPTLSHNQFSYTVEPPS